MRERERLKSGERERERDSGRDGRPRFQAFSLLFSPFSLSYLSQSTCGILRLKRTSIKSTAITWIAVFVVNPRSFSLSLALSLSLSLSTRYQPINRATIISLTSSSCGGFPLQCRVYRNRRSRSNERIQPRSKPLPADAAAGFEPLLSSASRRRDGEKESQRNCSSPSGVQIQRNFNLPHSLNRRIFVEVKINLLS